MVSSDSSEGSLAKLRLVLKRLHVWMEKCDNNPIIFACRCGFKLYLIMPYFYINQILVSWKLSMLLCLSVLYIWKLRDYEYRNNKRKAVTEKEGGEIKLASECLHFTLNSITSFGVFASIYCQGFCLFLMMLGASFVLLHTVSERYTGSYYHGNEKVPWYVKPFIKMEISEMAKVSDRLIGKHREVNIQRKVIGKFKRNKKINEGEEKAKNGDNIQNPGP